MSKQPDPESANYTIQVAGHLDQGWSARFEGMELATGFAEHAKPITTISGPIADQAALHGILARIRDLGLEILKVERTRPEEHGK